jgi:hypothetical protein
MNPDGLPWILCLQDKIIPWIPEEVCQNLETDFRRGVSLRELATMYLSEHQSWVAINAIRKILQERIWESEYGALTRGRWPKNQLERGIWIHGQTRGEKQEAGRAGAKKSGANPYDHEELSRLHQLLGNPEFRRKTRVNAHKIAEVLNLEFHNSELVRTSQGVRQQICRVTRRLKETLSQ